MARALAAPGAASMTIPARRDSTRHGLSRRSGRSSNDLRPERWMVHYVIGEPCTDAGSRFFVRKRFIDSMTASPVLRVQGGWG
jgi:hypothetical protein